MLPARIFWTITAVLIIVVALLFFPIDSFETYGIPCAMGLGALVGVLSYLAIAKVKNFSELYTAMYDKEAKSNNFANVVITFVIMVVASFLFYQLISHRIEHLLKTEGVYTQATIQGQQKESTRRRGSTYSTYNIKIAYNDIQSGKSYKVNGKIPKNIYQNLYQGQEIEVLYLPKHPSIFRLMIGDNITRYKQQQNRKMHLQDLDKLFGYSSSDEVLKKLREISPTWQEDLFEAGDDTIIEDGIAFYNQQLQESFLISPHGMAIYQSTIDYDFLQKAALEKVSEEDASTTEEGFSQTSTLYETASYNVKKMKVVNLKGRPPLQIFYLIQKK